VSSNPPPPGILPASIDPMRRTARIAGALYVLTFISIPTLALYAPVHEVDFILTSGNDTGVLVGGVLELIVALACIGTAVVLYPIVKRQDEAVALGFVGVRVLEAAAILIGIACLLTVVGLQQAGAGPDSLAISRALVGMHEQIFLLSQGTLPAFNALLLGSLLYRSRLVPRALPALGLIGAPILLASNAGVLFGLWDRVSAVTAVAVIPIALWELALGVWLLVKGFSSSHQLPEAPTLIREHGELATV
jgi:hypothetical protein